MSSESSYFPFIVMIFGLAIIIFSGMVSLRLRQMTQKFVNIPYYNSIVLYLGISLFCLILGILLGTNSYSKEYVFRYSTFYGTFSKFLLWIVSLLITIFFIKMFGDKEINQLKLYDSSTWGLILSGMSFGICSLIFLSIYMYFTISTELGSLNKQLSESAEIKKRKELKALSQIAEQKETEATLALEMAKNKRKEILNQLGKRQAEGEAQKLIGGAPTVPRLQGA